MRNRLRIMLSIIFIFSLLLFQGFSSQGNTNLFISPPNKIDLAKNEIKSSGKLVPDVNFGNIPLYFIHNKGQVNKRALFYAKTPGYTLWITKEGLVFDSIKAKETGEKTKSKVLSPRFASPLIKGQSEFALAKRKQPGLGQGGSVHRDISRLLFIGANKNPKIEALNLQKLKVNYFKGNDKSKWVGGIPTSGAVLYKNLYKNIDLKVYGIGKQIEYDWIVHPGGNPDDIKFKYKNVKSIEINKKGDLDITTKFGKLRHKKPVAYQDQHSAVSIQPSAEETKSQILNPKSGTNSNVKNQNGRDKKEIKSEFKKEGKNIFGFTTGKYDRTKQLIIDPVVLLYSTYLGGSSDDYGKGIAVDNSGYVYVTGFTSSTDFPTSDEYQGDQGGWDAFVTKLDTNKIGVNSLLYSTYLGGSSEDYGSGIAADNSGYVYVTGETWSSDFPTLNQYQGDDLSIDAFVTKINTNKIGAASLLYSTYLGGDNGDYGYGIAADNSGNVYVTGETWSTTFPTLNGYQGDQVTLDAFVTKLDTNKIGAASLLYSTYLGGNSSDVGYGIAADNSGYVYVTGETSSTDFPNLDQYQGDQGGYDSFVTKLDTNKIGVNSLRYSTYLGGSSDDYGKGIAVDNSGYVYVTGETYSIDFPTSDEYQGDQGRWDAFVTKLDTNKIGVNSLRYSTYLGGSSNESGYSIAVDNSEVVYVTGYTSSTDFPTSDEYQGDQGSSDAFVTKLDTNQSGTYSLLYSTYLGGNTHDYGTSIAVDNSGYVYVTGDTYSSNFPTLNGYQGDQGGRDAFVTKLAMEYTINASVSGGNGSVDPLSQAVLENQSGAINIYPDAGFEIDTITDNGILQPVSNPYIVTNIQENHTVVVTFRTISFTVSASVVGGNGTASPLSQRIDIGNNATITITPDTGYEIASITDNGVFKSTTYSYVINNVQESHNVVVKFNHIAYPPTLALTGVRKTEKAWILTKDYSVLNIEITEHSKYPSDVSRYVLYKKAEGAWIELQNYSGSGIYTFTDTTLQKGITAQYKLSAYSLEGSKVAESNMLEL